ncbi:MAG: UDP-N-acetylmuramoyl-L-alanyl-D-glutamate--2,6-diaminopimelate ligase [Candidatus Omnitrophota bacterium]
MRLTELVKALPAFYAKDTLFDFEVSGISRNSKEVGNGFLFVAVKGNQIDGHTFIREAIERGAQAIIFDTYGAGGLQGQGVGPSFDSASPEGRGVNWIKVDNSRKALALLAAEFYGRPGDKMKVCGITGTNGKTTISYLLEAIVKKAGLVPGVIGTLNYRFGERVYPSVNTTPGPLELQRLFCEMQQAKVDYAIMEVSSHALSQDRVTGLEFHSAIFTNLTQDHLDYHKTLEGYFQAKAGLFKNLKRGALAVFNNDDKYSLRLKDTVDLPSSITYGVENSADVRATEIKYGLKETVFSLGYPKGSLVLHSKLIGRHNVYNLLAAFSWGLKSGFGLGELKSGLEGLSSVPGRLERIDNDRGLYVFVDYAHTEDALYNAVMSLREVSCGKIIVVFGCGGQRDREKRPKMGRVVSELADYAVITNDNPRSDDPQDIVNDILTGIKKDNYCVILDRREAISHAFSLAKAGDVVLIAGKGHEDYQLMQEKKVHFDDREVARECLKSVKY